MFQSTKQPFTFDWTLKCCTSRLLWGSACKAAGSQNAPCLNYPKVGTQQKQNWNQEIVDIMLISESVKMGWMFFPIKQLSRTNWQLRHVPKSHWNTSGKPGWFKHPAGRALPVAWPAIVTRGLKAPKAPNSQQLAKQIFFSFHHDDCSN